jgi:hypothetical protein
MSYDQWKTASPYDNYDDEHCAHCGADLDYTQDSDGPIDDGYCSEECRRGEHVPCVRPMYDLLSQDLGGDYSAWDRAIYKATECGAWMRLIDERTVQVGSIVEGSDAEVTAPPMVWPFTTNDFWDMVRDVNREASQLWEEANYEDC